MEWKLSYRLRFYFSDSVSAVNSRTGVIREELLWFDTRARTSLSARHCWCICSLATLEAVIIFYQTDCKLSVHAIKAYGRQVGTCCQTRYTSIYHLAFVDFGCRSTFEAHSKNLPWYPGNPSFLSPSLRRAQASLAEKLSSCSFHPDSLCHFCCLWLHIVQRRHKK